jgi:glutamate 5-kinase
MKKKTTKERWVVKAGSNMICSGGPLLIRAWMSQIKELHRKHQVEVIWVSSGAISTAIDRTHFKKTQRTLSEKQALSAIGQPLVMDLYNIALQTQGLLGAQVLLTYDDLMSGSRKKNFQNTLNQLLAWEVTPILNENDAVATEEIKFGDNDSLSARVAKAMNADRLVILTDVNGLYEADPRKNPKAKMLSSLEGVSAGLLKKVAQSSGTSAGTARGTGGMFSKLTAAKIAADAGIETWLVKGDAPNVLTEIAQNKSMGTRILARAVAPKKSNTRKNKSVKKKRVTS